jgi:hypothetical protein
MADEWSKEPTAPWTAVTQSLSHSVTQSLSHGRMK